MRSFHIAPAGISDAEAITDLLILCDLDEYGVPDIVLEDTLDILHGLNLEKDTWTVRNSKGTLVGFAFWEQQGEGKLSSYGYVHPEYKGQGIGSKLLTLIQQRSEEAATASTHQPSTTWRLSNVIPALNEAAQQLLEDRGYKFVRLYSRMNIELAAVPPAPQSAQGIQVSPFRQGQDEHGVFEAYNQAFKENRLYSEMTEEDWLEEKRGEHYDRSLWFTAYEGSEVAGFVICKNFGDHVFVDLLGVKMAFRRRGLGLALLQHVFHEAYRKGIKKIMLSVDAESLTGAHKLYERAGMEAIFQMALYDKPLSQPT